MIKIPGRTIVEFKDAQGVTCYLQKHPSEKQVSFFRKLTDPAGNEYLIASELAPTEKQIILSLVFKD
jgi:hypothetical protein